jgi:tetratricopeptide (TPR) repeat protein
MNLEEMALKMIKWGKSGEVFRSQRKVLKLRQEDIADEHISPSTVSNIELGARNVKPDKYIYLAKKLGILEKLLGLMSTTEQRERDVKSTMREMEELMYIDPDKAMQRLSKVDLEGVQVVVPVKTFIEGIYYFYQKEWERGQVCFEKTIFVAKELSELEKSNLQAASLSEISRICYFKGDFQQALEYVEKGLEGFVRDGERKIYLYHLLLNKVIYFDELGRSELAYEAVKELRHEVDQLEKGFQFNGVTLDIIIQMYTMFAILLDKLNRPQKALDYAKQGMKIALENKFFDRLLTFRSVCGSIHLANGSFSDAEKYLLRALDLKEKVKHKEFLLIPAYQDLGLTYLQQNMWSQAEEMLGKAVRISQKTGNIIRLLSSLIALGNCFIKQKRFTEAIKPFQQTEELILQHGHGAELHQVVTNLCHCYEKIGDKERLQYYKEKLYHVAMKTWRCEM